MSDNSLSSKINDKFLKHESIKDDLKTPPVNQNFVNKYIGEVVKDQAVGDSIVSEKIQNKTLFLSQPPQHKKLSEISDIKLKRSQKRKNPITNRLKREFKCFQLDPKSLSYDALLSLNYLWIQYIRELKGNQNSQLFAEHLLKADLHGSILTVTKSKNHTLVNQSGIVLQEFKNIFKILTSNNRLLTISKSDSVFQIDFDGCTYELFGPQIVGRPADRSVKKFKEKPTIDL
ncbi:RNase P subunit p29-like protein [Conidiobolus coronatus NRRL 28638]|uniref:RNase P subunit p29-like protein n=1 Tax=Conidiobolus coronatus (strain ATCC 28846 / CBS 209.66 / NRRL 28638) TaxID=796925 RepID=A0A137P3C0_CONC2|nr:RNase P subunit p29-like protein [Conidiobolus coronatus NRRL 28638]|eukprot:KXN69525.1 RNase P subunit p29-like protein [Conidiobolus coronatus NRRL 28638]